MKRLVFCVLASLVFASMNTFGWAQSLPENSGERRSLADKVPDAFFEIFDAELLQLLLQYAPNQFSREDVYLLRFETEQFFEFDSDRLDLQAKRSVEGLADALVSEDNAYFVLIVGHTDSIGTIEYNDDLSRRRAEAVAKLLDARGVPTDKIQTLPMGERYPVSSNATSEGRARNRRVQVYMSLSANDIVQAPRATPLNRELQNDQPNCTEGPGECGPIAPEPLILQRPDGTPSGEVDMTRPITSTETSLRRRMGAPTKRRRLLPAPH